MKTSNHVQGKIYLQRIPKKSGCRFPCNTGT